VGRPPSRRRPDCVTESNASSMSATGRRRSRRWRPHARSAIPQMRQTLQPCAAIRGRRKVRGRELRRRLYAVSGSSSPKMSSPNEPKYAHQSVAAMRSRPVMKQNRDDVVLRTGVPFVQHTSAFDAACLTYPWVTRAERAGGHRQARLVGAPPASVPARATRRSADHLHPTGSVVWLCPPRAADPLCAEVARSGPQRAARRSRRRVGRVLRKSAIATTDSRVLHGQTGAPPWRI
jgi:hypothetical protein